MKRWIVKAIVFLSVLFVLAACGDKSADDVKKDLNEKMEKSTGYKATAEMMLNTGEKPQKYDVEIWHSKPDYYRVELKNAKKDQSQMILRNNEGVFVLTPALNKSFKFQSGWPQNSSQAYLYESLIKDIKGDDEAKFQVAKDGYIFTTKTNYQHQSVLPKQKIILDKKELTPKKVEIMDTDNEPIITVDFKKVEMNVKFDNMTAKKSDVPTMTSEEEPFSVKYPSYTPEGTEQEEEKTVKTMDGKRVVLTYGGEKSFTVIQEQATVAEASTTTPVNGDVVDLGFSIGALSKQSIQWTSDGVEFMMVASSLEKEQGK
jgi:outer membrane lipoprotein-sorting protein